MFFCVTELSSAGADVQHSGHWPSLPLASEFPAGEMSFVLEPRARRSMRKLLGKQRGGTGGLCWLQVLGHSG